jgi:hypothetical protein
MASVVNIDGDAQCIEKFLALQPKRTSLEIAALNGTDIPLLAVELRRSAMMTELKGSRT